MKGEGGRFIFQSLDEEGHPRKESFALILIVLNHDREPRPGGGEGDGTVAKREAVFAIEKARAWKLTRRGPIVARRSTRCVRSLLLHPLSQVHLRRLFVSLFYPTALDVGMQCEVSPDKSKLVGVVTGSEP